MVLSYFNIFSYLFLNIIVYCCILLYIVIYYKVSTSGRVGDGCSHEHDRLSEDLGTHLGGEDRVDPTLETI